MKYLASFAIAFLVTASVFAQGSYQLGSKVADFSLKDGQGNAVSLSNFADSKTVVLVFTDNKCPYAKLYENRLVTLSSTYAPRGVQFIFINPGVGVGEGSDTMQDLAAKNYSFPYLADEGQRISQKFGATKTPEVFVLHNMGGEFVLKYKGAIDDSPQVESGVRNNYLKTVIDDVLANKNISTTDKRATGCMIKRY
ncbi:thioredoxin family protein [Pontibacter sp. HSC-36F09]|uniref:thioredoxin family protein n=1 Tax=Pontibacter sp. HSC-36F09 TaxID=2910966 RepID=UPI0020A20545|nr:thioredoxin family protein [Pontibacter sp. HSC-36F09]MCP2042267.1 peroxiredoxin [Pontibacter sp. HSC-36F09]